MSINAQFPAQVSVQVSDAWLAGGAAPAGNPNYRTDSGGNQYFECRRRPDGRQGYLTQRPRGVKCTSVLEDATVGTIRGALWDENEQNVKNHPVNAGPMESLAFKMIYRGAGTTARGIIVYG